jgi:NADH-quinone oxidoreductase subunit G
MARPSWWVVSDLLAAVGERTGYFLPSEVFAALAASHANFAGMSYDTLGMRGLPVLPQQPSAQRQMALPTGGA